jgi:hypothetical protein
MTVRLKCPACQKSLKVPETIVGKKIRCPVCPHAFLVQDPAATQAPPDEPARRPWWAEPATVGRGVLACTGISLLLIGGAIGYGLGSRPRPPANQAAAAGQGDTEEEGPAGFADADWKPFRPPGGRFSVSVPVALVRQSAGPSTQVWAGNREGGESFHIFLADVEDAALAAEPFETHCRRVRDDHLRRAKGRLVREQAVTQDGFPGREYQLEVDGGGVVMRLVLVRGKPLNRVYHFVIGGKGVRPGEGDARRFFESLKIEPPPAAAEDVETLPAPSPDGAGDKKP